MRALAGALRARREAKGCIDLDMDEPEFILNERGEPEEALCACSEPWFVRRIYSKLIEKSKSSGT